jgi:hypothetical protein
VVREAEQGPRSPSDVAAPHFLTDHEVAGERIGKCTEEFRTVFEFQEYRQSNNDKPSFGTPTPNQNGSG